MKVIIMVCTKKIIQFKCSVGSSRLAVRIFLKFCRMKGANRYMEILLVVFREIWGNLIFLALRNFLLFDWAWSNRARPLLMGSLNSQDMISFMITTGS